jgi:hypothetical protein
MVLNAVAEGRWRFFSGSPKMRIKSMPRLLPPHTGKMEHTRDIVKFSDDRSQTGYRKASAGLCTTSRIARPRWKVVFPPQLTNTLCVRYRGRAKLSKKVLTNRGHQFVNFEHKIFEKPPPLDRRYLQTGPGEGIEHGLMFEVLIRGSSVSFQRDACGSIDCSGGWHFGFEKANKSHRSAAEASIDSYLLDRRNLVRTYD